MLAFCKAEMVARPTRKRLAYGFLIRLERLCLLGWQWDVRENGVDAALCSGAREEEAATEKDKLTPPRRADFIHVNEKTEQIRSSLHQREHRGKEYDPGMRTIRRMC